MIEEENVQMNLMIMSVVVTEVDLAIDITEIQITDEEADIAQDQDQDLGLIDVVAQEHTPEMADIGINKINK